MRRVVSRAEAFGTGFYFSMGVMSGLFLSTLLAAYGILLAWKYLGV